MGRTQAKSLRAKLENTTFDSVFSSDLARTIQTAEHAGFQPNLEPRLREIHFGIFEGETNAVVAKHPGFNTWLENPMGTKIEGGESYSDLEARGLDWLASLPESGEVLAFTHGGMIQVLVPNLLDTTTFVGPRWWRFRAVHASITTLERWKMPNGEYAWTLTGLNDTGHLERVFTE
jgi:broad specificity phosphatase PhoE